MVRRLLSVHQHQISPLDSPRYLLYISQISPIYAQQCLIYAQDMPKIYPRHPHDMPKIYPRYPQVIPKICSMNLNGLSENLRKWLLTSDYGCIIAHWHVEINSCVFAKNIINDKLSFGRFCSACVAPSLSSLSQHCRKPHVACLRRLDAAPLRISHGASLRISLQCHVLSR